MHLEQHTIIHPPLLRSYGLWTFTNDLLTQWSSRLPSICTSDGLQVNRHPGFYIGCRWTFCANLDVMVEVTVDGQGNKNVQKADLRAE